MVSNSRQLRRSRDKKMIAGVAAGVANFFGLNVTLIRAIWLISAIFGGMTLIIYVILWIVVPQEAIAADDSKGSEEE